MALKVINEINLRLKFLDRKNRFFTPAPCKALIQTTLIMHTQPGILISRRKLKIEFKSLHTVLSAARQNDPCLNKRAQNS